MRSFALALVVLSACADPGDSDLPLTISASTDSAYVIGGHSMPVTVSVDRTGGFEDAVEIVVTGLPDVTEARRITIGAGEPSGVLTFAAGPSVDTGTTVVTIVGQADEERDQVTLELTTQTQGGLIDNRFGTGGQLGHVGYCPMEGCVGTALAVQPDGKIVIAGGAWERDGTGAFVISRLTADGEPDPGFGEGGSTMIGAADAGFGKAIVVQPDGAIVVGGITGPHAAVVWRFRADGTLDETFGGGRVVLVAGGEVRDLALLPDGRIIAAGYRDLDTTPIGFLASLLPTGALDPDFADAGLLWESGALFSSVAALPDGRFLAAGMAYGESPVTNNYLRRYAGNGVVDPGFAAAPGAIWLGFGHGFDPLIAVQRDGKIVEAYSEIDGDGWVFAATRFMPDGALDTGFGGGDGTTAVPIEGEAFVKDLAIDGEGMIVIGGNSAIPGSATAQRGFAVARLTSAGELDPVFGSAGSVVEEVGAMFDRADAQALALQPDGRILVCGNVVQPNNGYSLLRLVRLLP